MSRIAIIAEPRLAQPWAKALRREYHDVETFPDYLGFQDLLNSEPFDILVIDIARPDWGETMLIPQGHAAWPECKIVAVVPNYQFRRSAVFEMGLWTPDQVLMKPLAPRLLCATVSFLWAQMRSEEIRRAVTGFFGSERVEEPAEDAGLPAPR